MCHLHWEEKPTYSGDELERNYSTLVFSFIEKSLSFSLLDRAVLVPSCASNHRAGTLVSIPFPLSHGSQGNRADQVPC